MIPCLMAHERLGALTLALVSLTLGAAGCHKSTGTGTGGAGGGGVDVATACATAAAAACARLEACLPLVLAVEDGDLATCTARQTAQCRALQGLAGMDRTAAELETCAADFASLTCADVLVGKPVAACAGKGSLTLGSPCFVDGQCATGRCGHDVTLPYGACGQCAVEVDVGGACDATATKPCKIGLFCGGDKACHAFAHQGDPCDAMTKLCQAPLACSGGSCVAPVDKAKGAACDPTKLECDLSQGLACSSATMTCSPLALAKAGDSCAPDATSKLPTLCEDSAVCVPSMMSAHCVAAVAEGQACVIDAASRTSNCQLPMLCLDAKCAYVPRCP